MKKKELRALAQKIAECENTIQAGENGKAVIEAQNEIMRLTAKIQSIQDLDLLDEMIQEILSQDFDF